MLFDKSILDIWRKGFLHVTQLDALAITSAWHLKNSVTSTLDYNSEDYLKHVSEFIQYTAGRPSTQDIAIYFTAAITSASVSFPVLISHYNNYRTALFMQEFAAPILLFPSTYKTEKENISDTSNVSKGEQSSEVNKLLKLFTTIIGIYPSTVTPDQYETEDQKTVTTLFTNVWTPGPWDPTSTTPTPYMDTDLRKCIDDALKILSVDGIFFDERLARDVINYWYNCFNLKATSTEVFDYLENEITKFPQYFASAKPSPGASEFFNPSVEYIKTFTEKANSRGTFQLISEKTIEATTKMMRRLNFATSDEKNTDTLTIPYEYQLIYLLTKGDSKLADLFKAIPDPIYKTVPVSPANVLATKPVIPAGIDLGNLFPGEFSTAHITSSFSSFYKNHIKILDLYQRYLMDIFIPKGNTSANTLPYGSIQSGSGVIP
jgi:hypothetical protein